MKPNFALSLSFEGIRLLHRAAGGWRLVNEVSLDAGDMAGELAMLRKTAASLEPGGVRAKLLIPNAQIKYLTIDTPDKDDAARRTAAEEALEGATPYAVSDLVFDISVDGSRTHVAAVARETLTEAEAFAVEHRFHPVSFAAIPGDQPYLGEPWFGPTATAPRLLEPGEEIEPDGIAVVVVGPATAMAPAPDEPADAKAATAQTAMADTAEDGADKTVEAVPEPLEVGSFAAPDAKPRQNAATGDPAPTPTPTEVPANPSRPDIPMPSDPVPDTPPAESPQPSDPEPTSPPEESPEPSAPETAPADPTPAPTPEEAPAPTDPAPPPAAPETPAEPPREAPQPSDPLPPADFMPKADPAQRPTAVAARSTASRINDPSIPASGPAPTPSLPPTPGFSSRRPSEPTVKSSNLAGGARREPKLGAPVAAAASPAEPTVTFASAPAVPDMPPRPKMQRAGPAPKGGFLSRRKTKAAVAPPMRAAVAGGVAVAAPTSEAERMTVFGARKGADVGGKPRFLGLILTAALLVFLAGVAAWASVFLDDGLKLSRLFGNRSPEITVAAPAEPAFSTPVAPEPDAVETASLELGLSAEDGAVLEALGEPEVAEPDVPLTEAELDAKYAATGIWARAPEVPPEPAGLIDIEDLYLTSIDPISTSSDAVALPLVESFNSDVVLAAVPSPVAAGTDFALDPSGLVIPTAQGAMSPDGVLVYLGRPPVVPPATPTRSQEVPQDTVVLTALAAARPNPRPGDLAETNERAQLDGLTRSELASFRPTLRPQSLQEAAEQATVITPQDTTAAVAAALSTATAIENATKHAVAASRRPDTRPDNFARIVRRTERSAPAEVETQVASAAAVAPRVVQPSIPSSASVAKQATLKNAINLRKVNLIGVYGKPSNRRALVRLSNGSYKKVVVGDRIDGGRVSAIGDSELRYTKGGRNVVLNMPNG